MLINTQFTSPNSSIRTKQIKFIILHYTEMLFEDALVRLCDPIFKVSSHYLIKETGEIFQLVDNENIAWHAGVSYWQGISALNECSIGIELDNKGDGAFDKRQLDSCIKLCKQLVAKYNIPLKNILGHSDIAPERKIDPGIYFDWLYLAEHNLGMWPHNNNSIIAHSNKSNSLYFGDCSPAVLELQSSLKKLGFNIIETGIFDWQTNFVIRSFQAHFYPELIKNLGVNHYRDINAKYFWDELSNQILLDLLDRV